MWFKNKYDEDRHAKMLSTEKADQMTAIADRLQSNGGLAYLFQLTVHMLNN